MAILDTLHDAVDHLADTVFVLIELTLTLSVAHFLHDHLLGGLGGDPAKIERRQLFLYLVTSLQRRVDLLGVRQHDLKRLVFDGRIFNHCLNTPQGLLTGGGVDDRSDIEFLTVFGFGRLLDRFLHRFDHDGLVDRFFFGNRFRDLQNLKPVG